jgi:hypothetical protein
MKIIQLEAENVKRLRAVTIRPDGNIVEISGRNGQGKSSVLDAIWWALSGTTHIQAVPIRKGENEARIRLDLGEIKVIRTFRKREDETFTTSLTVESTEGARYPSPQRMLDSLLGALSFDPLAFTRMDGKAQLQAMRRFVPGVDFEATEAANKADFDRRTDLNRQAKQFRAQAAGIAVPEDLPQERVDDVALLDELTRAGEHNAELERRKARRDEANNAARSLSEQASARRSEATELRRRADEYDQRAQADEIAADELRERIRTAPALPEAIDVAPIRARIAEASRLNAAFEARDRRAGVEREADRVESQVATLTAAIKSRKDGMQAAVAKAEMPVPGLTFGADEILLAGVPFDQASSAEQLRTSVAIAMAANPKLRVIRVQDGSLLDEEAMRILAEMAAEADYQVWIERVGTAGAVGIVIEDGAVRGAALAAAAE